MKRILKYIVLLLFCNSYLLSGQDLKSDLEQLYANTANQQEVTVKMFNTDTTGKRTLTYESQMVSGEGFFFFRTSQIDYLMTKDWYIMLNHQEKVLMARKQEATDFEGYSFAEGFVDSTLAKFTDITYQGISGNRKIYKTATKTATYKEVLIALNKETLFPESLHYTYLDPQQMGLASMEIQYAKTKKIADKLLSINHYVSFQEEKATLKNTYLHYELIQLD